MKKSSTNTVISIKRENSMDGVANWIIYINLETNMYFLEDQKNSFESITELIENLVNENSIVLQPIMREDWDIKHSDVVKGNKIGSGQYGEVYQGFFKNRKVAIKTCKNSMQQEDKVKFVIEGNQLKKFNHPNIVGFIGIAVDEEPIYIIMELVNGGSLLSYLKNHQNDELLPLKIKMDLCNDCAAGMQYLEECGVIHRDLAARNCLIEKIENDNLRLKISDFGLSKELDSEKDYYTMITNKTLPIRWAAVESFKMGIISHKTDVWSYGVTCWEIFSYGAQPHGMLSSLDIRELVIGGRRLEKPEDCPIRIFNELIKMCWLENPEQRPNFSKIIEIIKSLEPYEN
jgi:serine/threonine protein kinase